MASQEGIVQRELGLSLAPPDRARLTLPRFLEDVTRRFEGRIALRFGTEDWRFEDVADEARRFARSLIALGVEPGDRVAILLSNRPEWAVSLFAASQVGAIAVPINTFATPDERDYILHHAGASVLLMQRHLAGRDFVDELCESHPALATASTSSLELPDLPDLRHIVCLEEDALPDALLTRSAFLSEGRADADPRIEEVVAATAPETSGLLIYTSGTTDRPKGVLHAHQAAVIQSWRFAEMLDLVEDDIVFTAQPFFWTAGICMSLGATMAAGARLLLQETFSPEAALDCLERERATTIHAWVHQEKAMAEHPSAADRDLSALHRVEFDSPLAPLAGLEKDVWGIHASYGLTETFTLSAALPTWASASDRTGNSGRPLPGMQIRIVDPETGAERAPGESGEIAVRGVTLMQGYWNVPRENVLDEDGFFHTGDAGRIDEEGLLHWTGRLSGLIKTGGANVSPLEIEKAAAELPGVEAAIATGIAHPTLGQAIVLCLVPTEGHAIDDQKVHDRLRERLAAYKVPRLILTLSKGETPTTGSQKIRTEAVAAIALARLQASHTEIAGHVY